MVINTAFDVLFDFECILPGIDCVEAALRKKDRPADEIARTLFDCEGMYGWLYATYTGNPQDGYMLKYGYEYGSGEDDWKVGDLRRAMDIHHHKSREETSAEISKETEDAISFFEKNAILMSEDEFRNVENLGTSCVMECIENS